MAGTSMSASDGKVIGIDTFGESAPAGDLFKHFGFTENVVKAVEAVLYGHLTDPIDFYIHSKNYGEQT